jgi:hypothetical protein
MNDFLLQYKDIDVVIKPEHIDGKLKFEVVYDKKDLKEAGIQEEDFEKELNKILGKV